MGERQQVMSAPVSMDTVRLVFSLKPRPLHRKYPMLNAATCSSATGSIRLAPCALRTCRARASLSAERQGSGSNQGVNQVTVDPHALALT